MISMNMAVLILSRSLQIMYTYKYLVFFMYDIRFVSNLNAEISKYLAM